MKQLARVAIFVVIASSVVWAETAPAEPDIFPVPRPASRAEAVTLICGDGPDAAVCVRARLQEIGQSPLSPAVGRAVELLARGIDYAAENRWVVEGGMTIRYTTDVGAFDRVRDEHSGLAGRPEVVKATAAGLSLARGLLVQDLELPDPGVEDVLLVELGHRLDGYGLRSGRGHTTLVLDATPSDGADGARRAAIRQYAYAVAAGVGPALPAGWAEAFSAWAVLTLDGVDPAGLERMSERLRRMDEGLLADDPGLVAGNAVWFAFLEGMFGRTAVRVTLEELAETQPIAIALDRAMRRISDQDLAAALREFHVWSVMTGSRADDYHLPFAAELEFPGYAATAKGLPALSVYREPAVAPLGATQIRLVPEMTDGGLRLRFEGEFDVRWEVDLLLVDTRGQVHRLPLPLSAEGRGEITVPLDHVAEALMLVRNLEGESAPAQRYTYSAHHERSYPVDLIDFTATRQPRSGRGIVVSWQTATEQDLVGFNILRRRSDGTGESVVNPVWVPALGLLTGELTSYQFVDRSTEPEGAYHYRIQAITRTGLSSYSDAVFVAPAAPTR